MDLKGKLEIYKKDELVDELEFNGGNCALQLAVALSHKIGKQAKHCTINKNPSKNTLEIKMDFYVNGSTYTYKYVFEGSELVLLDYTI